MSIIQPLPQPATSSLPPAQVEKIRQAAQDFEAMAIGQLIKPMFDTLDQSHGLFGGGSGEQAWRPMWISALAKDMAKSGGIGLAQPIMQQMLRMQEQRNGSR